MLRPLVLFVLCGLALGQAPRWNNRRIDACGSDQQSSPPLSAAGRAGHWGGDVGCRRPNRRPGNSTRLSTFAENGRGIPAFYFRGTT
jgi:hypothetical protein